MRLKLSLLANTFRQNGI